MGCRARAEKRRAGSNRRPRCAAHHPDTRSGTGVNALSLPITCSHAAARPSADQRRGAATPAGLGALLGAAARPGPSPRPPSSTATAAEGRPGTGTRPTTTHREKEKEQRATAGHGVGLSRRPHRAAELAAALPSAPRTAPPRMRQIRLPGGGAARRAEPRPARTAPQVRRGAGRPGTPGDTQRAAELPAALYGSPKCPAHP